MRVNPKIQKFLSVMLALSMMLQYGPITVFAAEDKNHTAQTTGSSLACSCGTDDQAFHATDCLVYVAPENPECRCAEKCTEINTWCDVCGFNYSACTGEGAVAAYAVSGSCGPNATWSFDSSTGTLTISGNGAINNYSYTSYGGTVTPWNAYAKEITSVNIAEGITSIGDYAFSWCSKLTELTIPASVTNLGSGVFYLCSSLAHINVVSGNTTFASLDGVLFSKDQSTLIRLPSKNPATTYVIPDTVTTIGDYAFDECYNLTDIQFGKNVTTTGKYAFSDCTGLTTISVPATVTSLGYGAFSGCAGLVSATIPGSVGSIGSYTFSKCKNLKNVTLGSGITTIGNRAFQECTSLRSIVIPDGTTLIGTYAFYKCTILKLVVVPRGLSKFDHNAFYDCTALNHILYKGSAPSYIGDNNDRYINVAIRHSGTSGTEAVVNADGTVFCTICGITGGQCGDNLYWTYDGQGTLTVTGTGDMNDYTNTDTPWEAYKDELTAVVIGEGVTSVGYGAFMSCSLLKNVSLPETLDKIGSHGFSFCKSLEQIQLPDGLQEIGGYGFASSGLKSIHLGSMVKISDVQNPFDANHSMQQITVAEDNPYHCVVENVLFTKDMQTLVCYPSGIPQEIYTVPDGVRSVGRYAFGENKNIAAVVFPDTLVNLKDRAFFSCFSLRQVTLPSGLQIIESLVFCNTDIRNLVIPASVKSIGQLALAVSYALESVVFEGDVPEIHSGAFGMDSNPRTVTAYYPADNDTWTEDKRQNYGGNITWIPYGESEEEIQIQVTIPGSENSGAAVTAPESGWKAGTNTFIVSCSKPCVVAVSYDGGETYVKLTATAEEGCYSFTAEDMTVDTIVAVAVCGDTNCDGKITNADVTRLRAAFMGKTTVDSLTQLAIDANGDGKISNADVTRLRAVFFGKTSLNW